MLDKKLLWKIPDSIMSQANKLELYAYSIMTQKQLLRRPEFLPAYLRLLARYERHKKPPRVHKSRRQELQEIQLILRSLGFRNARLPAVFSRNQRWKE